MTLEAGRRLGVLAPVGDEIVELGVDVVAHRLAQGVEIDRAGPHDGGGVEVVDQAEQQMLERGVFVPAFVRRRNALWGLLEIARTNDGMGYPCFFHDALQRVLVLSGVIHHLRDLGLGDFVGVNAAFADACWCTCIMMRQASFAVLRKYLTRR